MCTHAVASLSTPPAAHSALSAAVMCPPSLRDELLGVGDKKKKTSPPHAVLKASRPLARPRKISSLSSPGLDVRVTVEAVHKNLTVVKIFMANVTPRIRTFTAETDPKAPCPVPASWFHYPGLLLRSRIQHAPRHELGFCSVRADRKSRALDGGYGPHGR